MCLAIPGEILAIEASAPGHRKALVGFGHVTRTVSLACTPEAEVGDYVLVHVGIAIARLNREEAERTLALLHEVCGDADA